MLEGLKVNNFSSGEDQSHRFSNDSFILNTCQRKLVISYGYDDNCENDDLELTGKAAYQFLLETICGLQSKLVGENEIVGQFKSAYQSYAQSELRSNKILTILEKLFKDAKEIRSEYLLGLSQKTYASITRKKILKQAQVEKVLILGSGQLAEDLINQLKKKVQVYVSARNTQRLKELSSTHEIEIIEWKNFEQWSQFSHVANSIGCSKGAFITEEFFQIWKETNTSHKLFIDLGSPSVIKTELSLEDGVVRLDQIFKEGAIHEDHKLRQIDLACEALPQIVEKRHRLFKTKQSAQKKYLGPKQWKRNISSEREEAS